MRDGRECESERGEKASEREWRETADSNRVRRTESEKDREWEEQRTE
jgi:hypothetical protein